MGAFRALTDARGLVSLDCRRVSMTSTPGSGYEFAPDALHKTVEVAANLSIPIEAAIAPEKNPDDDRVWM